MVLKPGSKPASFYLSTATTYVWDDHDFGPNNAKSDNPGKPAAQASFRANAPHEDLRLPQAGSIERAFTRGRVRFIVTDGRSNKSPDTGGGASTVLGADQKEWVKQELLAARSMPWTVLTSGVPWISRFGSDTWAGYGAERAELSDFIHANSITNVIMFAGDSHMVAFDDGSHNRYSAAGARLFPVVQAGPIDSGPSLKGGPYSHGCWASSRGQYVRVSVVDGGPAGRVCLVVTGRSSGGEDLFRYDTCAPTVGTANCEEVDLALALGLGLGLGLPVVCGGLLLVAWRYKRCCFSRSAKEAQLTPLSAGDSGDEGNAGGGAGDGNAGGGAGDGLTGGGGAALRISPAAATYDAKKMSGGGGGPAGGGGAA